MTAAMSPMSHLTTKPKGGFYFLADFNELSGELKQKGVMNSNGLGEALLAHPFHVATVTGDALMLSPNDYGARIAFVDYDGKRAYEMFRDDPPLSPEAEVEFVRQNAPQMIQGVESLRHFTDAIRD